MSRFGFCGPTYAVASLNADAQRCINWYVENNESGEGKSSRILLPTPGLSIFANIPGAQNRGEYTINGRTFSVVDAQLYEALANGTSNALGAVANDGNLVTMAANPQQLAVASAGKLYVFYLRTVGPNLAGTFVQVPANTFPGPVSQILYLDSFGVAVIASTEQYFVSSALDFTTWPGANTTIISTFPDNVLSAIVDHRELYLLGGKASEVDYDAGTSPVPLATAPGGFIEQGCGAQAATVQLDNSIFWIGSRNDLGNGIAWRSNGYSPQRVSNHAVENAWQSYATIADARAFPIQIGGHSWWWIVFPTGQAGWVYDAATGMWFETGFWFAQAGIYQAPLPQCHTFAFGKHLVGDRQSGKIYQMSLPTVTGGGWNFVTDNNNAIRRLRRAPHISTEAQWIYHNRLQVDVESGVSPQPPLRDGAGNPRDPMLTLKYSDDGGHTWSSGRDVGFGQPGKFRTRAIWRRLGRSRDRVYELTCSDPVPVRIIDAYLDATPGFTPQERVSKQYSKVA